MAPKSSARETPWLKASRQSRPAERHHVENDHAIAHDRRFTKSHFPTWEKPLFIMRTNYLHSRN